MIPIEVNPIYKVSSNAVFETFEDEVVVINMTSGSYFALDEVALGVWTQLQEHRPLQRIIETTQRHYQGDPATIEEAVKVLVDDLEDEGLIIRVEKGTLAEDASESAGQHSGQNGDATNRPLFQKPVLSKFTDMQDLLLLDPIHEVDEMGWPHAKAALQVETPSDSPS